MTLRVKYGKDLDVLALKNRDRERYKVTTLFHHYRMLDMFANRETVQATCPICGSYDTTHAITIHGGRYKACSFCTHVYLENRMTAKQIKRYYRKNKEYARTYTDKETTEFRIEQIAKPKVLWAIEEFKSVYGREPRYVLDVGAGGGHIVHAFRWFRIPCTGIEISKSAREFAEERFGLGLADINFLKLTQVSQKYEEIIPDLICFWGVLEHLPKPMKYLEHCRKIMGKEGMVIAEVPNWKSGSTIAQMLFPDTAWRHLNPEGHVHIFTRTSLHRALTTSGFTPTAAWHFGMDAYEFWTQFSLFEHNKDITGDMLYTLQYKISQFGINKTAYNQVLSLSQPDITAESSIKTAQATFDHACAADEMVMIAHKT